MIKEFAQKFCGTSEKPETVGEGLGESVGEGLGETAGEGGEIGRGTGTSGTARVCSVVGLTAGSEGGIVELTWGSTTSEVGDVPVTGSEAVGDGVGDAGTPVRLGRSNPEFGWLIDQNKIAPMLLKATKTPINSSNPSLLRED